MSNAKASNPYEGYEKGYPPTLLQYAEVIEWLNNQRDLSTTIPTHLKRSYEDALDRVQYARIVSALQDRSDRNEG